MRSATVMLALFVAGCTTASDLSYSPALAPVAHGAPAIGAVTVTDLRGEPDPTYVGGIRSGFGNRLKTLVTRRPVGDDVRDAFIAALTARGMYAANGREALDVRLTQLSSNQVARREATTAFSLEVRDRSGRPIYEDRVEVTKINGSLVTFDAGALGSIDALRAITVQAMTEAIDQALDKPGFAAATQQPGS